VQDNCINVKRTKGTPKSGKDAVTMFAFVTVTHPDDFKDQKRQGKLRRHAIRNGIKKSRVDRAKEEGIFVHADIDEKTGQLRKWAPPKVGSLMNSPSISLLDPFNTLSGCPERLRALMRHRMYFMTPIFVKLCLPEQHLRSRLASQFSVSKIQASSDSKAWIPSSRGP
jgi:hypothetical protein